MRVSLLFNILFGMTNSPGNSYWKVHGSRFCLKAIFNMIAFDHVVADRGPRPSKL